ncbi:hypothetical protein MKW92_015319 [Papaver armeniacum]|nr:hypothetical protein MKW92_015319 [Papaver armeniacum]
MKFAVQTSILSKRWRHVWTSLLTLRFTSWEVKKWTHPILFVNLVDTAFILRNHKSDINKFLLEWHFDDLETDIIKDHLNTWITAALNHNIVQLSVDISGVFDTRSESEIVRHQFLSNLFNCGVLTKLKLKVDIKIYSKEAEHYCKDYFSKITFPKSMDLHCLIVLEFDSLDIDNANNLFLRSNFPPLLEYLSIKGCKISVANCSDKDRFDIESLTLKYLELKNCIIMPKKIKLNVPNLQTFVCEDYTWREYSMVIISSLVCAHIEMLDFRSQGEEEHYYLKLPKHEKELCATRVMDFLKALDIVNELQLSPGILENLFSSNTILVDDLTKHRFSFGGNTG